MGLAGDLIIIIVVGLAGGLIFNLIKLPPIIGYIIAGVIISSSTSTSIVADISSIELLAEIGVALLLFSIGLELSFSELKDVRGIAVAGTSLQILLCIFFGYGIGHFMGLPVTVSIVFGMIIALSSTMVVLKVLMGKGLMGTLSSKVMIGILIVQDLAAMPLMIIIPKLHDIQNNLSAIGIVILKEIVVLIIIVIIGMRLIPFLLKYVALLNSRELFLIASTAIGLGVGYVTHLFDLSLAFGAFIAGMIISESDYNHQALNDVIPLRDIFGLIFFVSIGMLVNFQVVISNISTIAALVVVAIIGKFIIFYFIALIFKYRNIVPLALGLGLAQIGEFAFVLAKTAEQGNVIDKNFYSTVLSVSIITMIISPFISMLSTPLYSLRKKWFKFEKVQTINMPNNELKDHVVISGGGRVGSQIALVLNRLNIPFIIIEQDYRRFEKIKEYGYPAIYGDAIFETVLSAADVEKAKMLIITLPSTLFISQITSFALKHNPNIFIIARAEDIEQVKQIGKLNIGEVVQPEFEASLEIIRQTLLHLNFQITGIQNIIDEMRRDAYSYDNNQGLNVSLLSKLKDTPFLLETGWYEIKPDSIFEGKSIVDMEIREKTGVSIVGIMRDGNFIPNPDPKIIFKAGDLIAVIGIQETRTLFEQNYFQTV
ncbi:MAG: cation:proton antiporter [Spirochaetes bacterium]|nr:cation:proton antiporter [Spirochaetota bacterium]